MRLQHLLIPSLAALVMGAAPAVETVTDPTPGAAPAGEDGSSITIETSDKPLDTVLQWISRRAGVNVVCNEEDQPRITVRLVNVTWQEAVQQIAAKYDLVVERTSDRVWQLTRPPKVRMEFQDARLPVVLEALARQANINIVISGEVSQDARVSMTLNGVPWREALDVIVRASGYAWIEQEYNIIRIVSPSAVQKDLVTRIYHLNYTQAPDVAKVLEATRSADGKVVVDARTNNLIVTDTPPAHDKLVLILEKLDSRTRQVLISMKFVEFIDSDVQKLGFDPINLTMDVANVGQLGAAFSPFNATPAATVGLARTLTNVPTTTGNVGGNVTFEAITSLNSTEILQEPQLLTLDNTEAKIFIGRKVSFAEETVSNENGVLIRTLQEAKSSPIEDGITITVTPSITTDGFVSLKLDAKFEDGVLRTYTNKANPNDPNASQIQLPEISVTQTTTSIMVADGRTGTIGGLLKNRGSQDVRKVSALGDIPGLGWLFKKKTDSVERRNLTIFITPRIIRLDQKSEYEQRLDQMKERLGGK